MVVDVFSFLHSQRKKRGEGAKRLAGHESRRKQSDDDRRFFRLTTDLLRTSSPQIKVKLVRQVSTVGSRKGGIIIVNEDLLSRIRFVRGEGCEAAD
jgi:hypothetical protein